MGVLALIVALLTFIVGIVGGIGAMVRYFSTLATRDDVTAAVSEALKPLDLATTDHVTAAVSEALKPLSETVDRLDETVDGLATRDDVTAAVSEAVGPLSETVGSLGETVGDLRVTVGELGGTVGGFETAVGALNALSSMVQTLNITVQGLNNSVNTLNNSLDGSVDTLDALNSGLTFLVSCVIALHGSGVDRGWQNRWSDAAEALVLPPDFELPGIGTCNQAIEWANSQAAPSP